MRKLQEWFNRAVHWLEENPAPLSRYVQLFFAILSLRLTLEFFSNHRLFRLEDVIHIGLWFSFIVLTFLSLLQGFSKVEMQKVAKLVVVCFSLALSAPIIDLITAGPGGTRMGYLSINSSADIIWAYFTIGGSSIVRGATLGIRIEIVLLVIAAFHYIWTRRGRLLPAIIGAWALYTALFLSGTVPYLLVEGMNALKIPFSPEDQSTNLLLLCLNLALVLWVLSRHRPAAIMKPLRAAPWLALSLACALFITGFQLGLQANPGLWQLNSTTVFWLPLLIGLLLCTAALAGRGKLNAGNGVGFSAENMILLVMIVLGLALSGRIAFSVVLIWGLLFLYYQPPLRICDWPFMRNVLFGLMLCSAVMLGFVVAGAPMVGIRGYFLLSLGAGLCLLHWLLGTMWNEGGTLLAGSSAKKIVRAGLCIALCGGLVYLLAAEFQ